MTQPQLIRQKIVDSREPPELRTKLLELGWEQKFLVSGDLMFLAHDYRKIGITRKTIPDLLKSIGDEFSHHLDGMLDYYDVNILLVEGSWASVSPRQNIITSRGVAYYTWDLVWNYLHRWMAKGFILELTGDLGHTIKRVNTLYALYQKSYSLSARSKRYTDDRILALPSGVRGKTGEKVLEKLGSLKAVANATAEELMAIEKIGEKKAELIYHHFHRGEDNRVDNLIRLSPKALGKAKEVGKTNV